MSTMKVLVYDDNPEIADSLANKVRAVCDNATVTAVKRETFQELIGLMNRRRANWRAGENDIASIGSTDVDEADVVVVDYDLLRYSDASGYHWKQGSVSPTLFHQVRFDHRP